MATPTKKKQMPSHVRLKPNIKDQTDYKSYRLGGGGSNFNTWKRENNRM